MINGLSIAAISELRHEVEDNPNEAPFKYTVQANWSRNRSFSAKTATAVIGTIRVPRSFNVQLTDVFAKGPKTFADEWHPVELALIGIGGCVMATYMMGCTTKGVAIAEFSLEFAASYTTEGIVGRLDRLSYKVDILSDGEDAQLSELGRLVSQFSPNLRTIVEQNVVTVISEDFHRNINSNNFLNENISASESKELKFKLDWESGFQMLARSCVFNESDIPYLVDQPKQAAGIDMGTNPQECLLLGLSGNVLQSFVEVCRKRGLMMVKASVEAVGTVDVRGILGVDPSVPVKVQDLQVSLVSCLTESPKELIDELFLEAVKSSSVVGMLINNCPIDVAVSSNGNQVCSFKSES